MATATYQQMGGTLDYKNSGTSKIAGGTIVSLTTRIGIAAGDIPAGTVGALAVEGVFVMPKKAATAITLGAAVYYNATDDDIDTTASGGVPAGYAVAAAAAADTTVTVKLPG